MARLTLHSLLLLLSIASEAFPVQSAYIGVDESYIPCMQYAINHPDHQKEAVRQTCSGTLDESNPPQARVNRSHGCGSIQPNWNHLAQQKRKSAHMRNLPKNGSWQTALTTAANTHGVIEPIDDLEDLWTFPTTTEDYTTPYIDAPLNMVPSRGHPSLRLVMFHLQPPPSAPIALAPPLPQQTHVEPASFSSHRSFVQISQPPLSFTDSLGSGSNCGQATSLCEYAQGNIPVAAYQSLIATNFSLGATLYAGRNIRVDCRTSIPRTPQDVSGIRPKDIMTRARSGIPYAFDAHLPALQQYPYLAQGRKMAWVYPRGQGNVADRHPFGASSDLCERRKIRWIGDREPCTRCMGYAIIWTTSVLGIGRLELVDAQKGSKTAKGRLRHKLAVSEDSTDQTMPKGGDREPEVFVN
ncbi:hypothetical protein CERSUDRAFT_74256 [Gelatoporia subvermispora B]|uniref:Uncharacterized protein n=1 Tax=Ceriporiopsis subvermispora (strain B) TaxID=914234 RepID=M2RBQ7_CERS8|nr:hypothetical protein CERSUDRAFT_74256 [Gelatoporia subvermispora B]